MTRYNEEIVEILKNFEYLWKVECVGDCVVVASKNDYPSCKCVIFDLILFGKIFFDKLKIMRHIFNSESIHFRVGINYGEIATGTLTPGGSGGSSGSNGSSDCSKSSESGEKSKKPSTKKYQIFGDTVNVCSRLESSSYPGVINISLQALEEMKPIYHRIVESMFIKSKVQHSTMKGVGDVKHVHLSTLSWNTISLDFSQNIPQKIEKLKSTFFRKAHLKFDRDVDIYEQILSMRAFLVEFRNYEVYNRNRFQKIYICLNNVEDIIDDKQFEDIKNLINGYIVENFDNENEQRYVYNQEMFARHSVDVSNLNEMKRHRSNSIASIQSIKSKPSYEQLHHRKSFDSRLSDGDTVSDTQTTTSSCRSSFEQVLTSSLFK